MVRKIFSKRHPEIAKEVSLSQAVRQRIWYAIEDCDPYFEPNNINNNWTICWDSLPDRLKKEHGWQDLRAYKSQADWEVLSNSKDFILRGVPRFVVDAIELFFDLLQEDKTEEYSRSDPSKFPIKINIIFEEANLPWRMLERRIIRIDSKWLEEEIHAKNVELLSIRGFEGALAEFQQARTDLLNGDNKGAIHSANLALESTIKSILQIDQEKPGKLIRKLIDSGLIPKYHDGFLKAFEEHILRAVPMTRNFEKGVGHGQGAEVNEPTRSLAELAINLSGVLVLYLLKRHLECHPIKSEKRPEFIESEDDIPF
jgi:hypothetical protein